MTALSIIQWLVFAVAAFLLSKLLGDNLYLLLVIPGFVLYFVLWGYDHRRQTLKIRKLIEEARRNNWA